MEIEIAKEPFRKARVEEEEDGDEEEAHYSREAMVKKNRRTLR